jgi:nucleoside-diphosphate-sugar epimerase
MKVVLTGGLGHIGSRLVRELPRFFDHLEVVIIDNLATQRYCSLFNLPGRARYRFVEGDVTAMELEELLAGADAVVHLAALTDPGASFDHPEAMERVNFAATQRVAETCARVGAALVHVSSTSIYGTAKHAVDEDCSPEDIAPQSPYADCKRREELLIERMCGDGSLQAMTFRFGTIFGISPGMRFHTAVNKFCWQAVMGKPLTVWRTALDQRRPYLDLGDAVRAVAFVIERRMFDGRIYNAVTANSTVREVTDTIRRHVPSLVVDFVDSRVMNSLSYDVHSSRLNAVGFEMRSSLDQGIADTLQLLMHAHSRDF